ncbi:MAG: helix-turn-helix transcriptional regulator [Clostridia bacterium]|nr:helix-turn-helix transcriptional regulator [Clostridia bacterium]
MGKENSFNKSIGKNIKLARVKAKYTQEELAEEIGISARYVSQLERGLAFGSANTIVSICKALNIDSNFLFNDLINPQNSTSMNNLVNTKFLQSYIQLNTANKQFVDIIVNQLLKLQNDTSKQA